MKVDNIKTPTIATVTFEVKVLKIGGSKCTISVFKQIPALKNLFDIDDIDFGNVSIWGRVLIEQGRSRKQETIIIWQYNGMLFKSYMPSKYKIPSKKTFLETYEYFNVLKLLGYQKHDNAHWAREELDEKGEKHKYLYTNIHSDHFCDRIIKEFSDLDSDIKAEFSQRYDAHCDKIDKWNSFVEKCHDSDQIYIAT